MTLQYEAVPAPAIRRAMDRGLVQRCGGISCPPGTCQHTDDPADAVHRSADLAAAPASAGVPASVLRVVDTPGTPLDASTRTSMETRLGHDFGHVRVHTDDEAARSARSIQAHAYTFGSHVVLGAGRYQPHTPAGSRLLTHELIHVAQQVGALGTQLPTSISDPGDASELEAADCARAVTSRPTQAEFPFGPAVEAITLRRATEKAMTGASVAGGPVRIQRQCDPTVQSCLPQPTAQVTGGGPVSRNPADLSDAELAQEFQRVLREGDPATADYLQALQTEARQRMVQRVRSSPADDPGIAAAAGMISMSGGPYHPPVGVSLSCTAADDCSTLSLKINYLRHTIAAHIAWDSAHPMPEWPGGRHAQEIRELTNAVENCKALYTIKCTNQPRVYPPPVIVPEEASETAAEGAEAAEAAETLEAAETVEVGVEAAEGLELLELLPVLLVL